MQIDVFFSAAVSGVPLTFVVFGLVWWYSQAFKLQGRTQTISSLLTGVVLGAGYMVMIAAPPTGTGWWPVYAYWFSVVIYGLGLGVLASGVYEASKDLLLKVITSALIKVSDRNPNAG